MITQLMKYKDLEYEDKKSRIYGVVSALVTNNKDPDNLGRVKLKYPWLGEAKDKESYWARMTTFMAGKDRGAYFLPEVDDEVLVAFENGDINFPYVIGTLWNGVDKPIKTNEDGKNNIKAIHSRSGHKITLDDTKDSEKITIEDKTGERVLTFDVANKALNIENNEADGVMKIFSKAKLTVESEDAIDIKAKKDISIKTDGDIILDGKNVHTKSSASTTVKSSAKFEVSASSGVTLDTKGKLQMKGTAGAALESSATLDLKGTGPATLQSSAITTVKGSLVKVN